MPNYYEILEVHPSATLAEIEAAYESRYNQWRRLVTHHDPSVVNQANQALQALETIRSTLTDPAKRTVYDAGIGLSGPIGGLADPAAMLRMTPGQPMTPPAPHRQSIVAPTATTPSSLWVCPKCGADNPDRTKHCLNCGTQLVRECPACGEMASLVTTGICGQCGTRYDVALRRVDIKTQMNGLQSEVDNLNLQIRAAEARGKRPSSTPWWIGIGLVLCGLSYNSVIWIAIIGIVVLFFAYRARQSKNEQLNSEIYNLTRNLNQKQEALRTLQLELERA